MKLHLTTSEDKHLISGYGSDWVQIAQLRHKKSLLVLPEQIITDWGSNNISNLTEEHFENIAALKPEVVLLGTGARLCFPHPRLWRCLADAGIGMECMDTGAACRTYNILMAEGRRVAAALILPDQ